MEKRTQENAIDCYFSSNPTIGIFAEYTKFNRISQKWFDLARMALKLFVFLH